MSGRLSSACAAGSCYRCGVVRCDCHCHVVVLCEEPGCRRVVRHTGGYCPGHRKDALDTAVVAYTVELTDAQVEELRQQVAADAQPLFIAAMAYILARQASAVGIHVALEAH